MMSSLQSIWNSIKRFGFVDQRQYQTTAPIHHHLNQNTLTNLWGWKPFSTFVYAISSLRKKHTHLDTNERIIEVPWIFSQIDLTRPKKVLDIGWLESTVAVSLATAGFNVTGIDIRQGELTHPNLNTVVGDICDNTFSKNTFDYVILLSTLEHIGLDTMYGKAGQKTSDQVALDECLRILKPGGTLLLTTPVGSAFAQNNFMRIYTPQRLKKMLASWKVESLDFYVPQAQRHYWQKATTKTLPQPPHFGVALIQATKPKIRSAK